MGSQQVPLMLGVFHDVAKTTKPKSDSEDRDYCITREGRSLYLHLRREWKALTESLQNLITAEGEDLVLD